MKNIITLQIFIFSWIFGFSQNSVEDYKDKLRDIDNMKSYFEYYDEYSNSKYFEYLKGIEGNLIDTIYYESGKESGYLVEYVDNDSIIYKIGVWTKKRKGGSIKSYSFYNSRDKNTGPNWFYRKDGSVSEKMWWHQTRSANPKNKFKTNVYYEFYSITFYKNGNKKREGDFINGVKNGLWKYYSKTGIITKEKHY